MSVSTALLGRTVSSLVTPLRPVRAALVTSVLSEAVHLRHRTVSLEIFARPANSALKAHLSVNLLSYFVIFLSYE